MSHNEDFRRLGKHGPTESQAGLLDAANRVALFDEIGKQFGLARRVVMHGDDERWFHLLDNLHEVLKS